VEKKTLMIVDSDENMRAMLMEELAVLTKLNIIDAKDGWQAFQKASNQKISIILSEFDLPRMSGPELLTRIRELPDNDKTPFVFYTEKIPEVKILTRAQKEIEYIPKPSSVQLLADKILEIDKRNPRKKRFRLDVDFVNPFIDCAVIALNALCGVNNIKALKPYLLSEQEELNIDISGNLEISGPYFEGNVAISFSDETYKILVDQIKEEWQETVPLDHHDGAAEMLKHIYAQAREVLIAQGFTSEKARATVLRGSNHKIYPNSKIPVLLVPFNSDAGKFFIQICVKAN
jgi:CheY-specific phosphatase CheX